MTTPFLCLSLLMMMRLIMQWDSIIRIKNKIRIKI
jgi:hypothetical protein